MLNKKTLLDIINEIAPQPKLADAIEKSMNEMRGYNTNE